MTGLMMDYPLTLTYPRAHSKRVEIGDPDHCAGWFHERTDSAANPYVPRQRLGDPVFQFCEPLSHGRTI